MSQGDAKQVGFAHAPGRWVGKPEVYDAAGQFLGFATDQRRVQDLGGGLVSIDLKFDGPIKLDGHYHIHDYGTYRNYLGPANVGGAEILDPALIDSTSYWTALGLNQRFMLMILPDEGVQLSLSLLSQGEILKYVVVGENVRVTSDAEAESVLSAEHTAETGSAAYSEGVWTGDITLLDQETGRKRIDSQTDEFSARSDDTLSIKTKRTLSHVSAEVLLRSDGQTLWTLPEQPIVGSASLWGRRAMSSTTFSSTFDDHPPVRAWRREVIRRDGKSKAVVTLYTQSGRRIAAAFGLMKRTDL